ncbi:hypothetical protein [Kingella pumchi]|uniref:Uncharacterized protein n=1 Tax=Kingella pumchi TaxID=2779506 RepID=A0ABS9NKE6_9NEIS|nr:hypothetical protein [Kingella pumchi]MCG6503263.1 hypothetical protein [Kingella pumchi]
MSRTAGLKSAQYSGFGGGGVWDLENGGSLKTKRQPENSAKPTGNVISCASPLRYPRAGENLSGIPAAGCFFNHYRLRGDSVADCAANNGTFATAFLLFRLLWHLPVCFIPPKQPPFRGRRGRRQVQTPASQSQPAAA